MRNAGIIAAMFFALWSGFELRVAIDLWGAGGGATGLEEGSFRQQAIWLIGASLGGLILALGWVPAGRRAGTLACCFIVGIVEIGFITQQVLPGHVPLISGLIGPVVGGVGIFFALIAISFPQHRRVFTKSSRFG